MLTCQAASYEEEPQCQSELMMFILRAVVVS